MASTKSLKIDTSFGETRYPSALELIQLQVIHRHGPRAPLNYRLPQFYGFSLPLCSKSGESGGLRGLNVVKSGNENLLIDLEKISASTPNKADCLLGELTDHGRRVMNELGATLRRHYLEKLNFKVALDSLHLRSTNYPRTIDSLSSLLRGFFRSGQDMGVDTSLLPILVRDEYIEDMYGSHLCHRYKRLLDQFVEKYARENKEHAEALKKSLPHVFDIPDLYGHKPSIYGVYDTLSSRQEHGLSLPTGVDAAKMAEMEKLAADELFGMFHNSPETIRFGIGRFIHELHSNLFRRDRAMCIYSGHDSTIAPLLSAFQYPSGQDKIETFVPYAANIIIEHFVERAPATARPAHYVRILSNGHPMIIPKCSLPSNHHPSEESLCRLEVFSEAMSQFIQKNYVKECRS